MHKDKELTSLYEHYAIDSLGAFRDYCIERIKTAKKPNHQLIDAIEKINTNRDSKTEDIILKKTDDFFLKGQGNGVI